MKIRCREQGDFARIAARTVASDWRAIQKNKVEAMADYLLKTEPSTYSFADLQKDKETEWDGVSNPVALRNMRGRKTGAGLCHNKRGDEQTPAGTATVVSIDNPNAKTPV